MSTATFPTTPSVPPTNSLPIVPHYGAYNNNVYGNYQVPHGYSAAGQPQQQQPQQRQDQFSSNYQASPDQSASLSAGAARNYQQPVGGGGGGAPVLLDIEGTHVAMTDGNENTPPSTTTEEQPIIPSEYDIPLEVIASQERALAQIRNRQTVTTSNRSSSNHGNNARGNYNNYSYDNRGYGTQSLVVPQTIPRSTNPTGSDAVHPQKHLMKQARSGKTALGVAGGAVLGGLAFGPAFPVGMVLGGTVAGVATNKVAKAGERRAQRTWEQQSFQRGTMQSPAVAQDSTFA